MGRQRALTETEDTLHGRVGGAVWLLSGIGLLGAALLGLQARWMVGPEPGLAGAFEVRWFGAALAELDGAAARALAERLGGSVRWIVAGFAALLAALLVRPAARWLGLQSGAQLGGLELGGLKLGGLELGGLGLGLFSALFFMLDPGLLAFVLARQPASALAYLDVTHAARAAGLAALFCGLLPWLPAVGEPRRTGAAATALSLLAAGALVAVVPELLERWALGDGPLTNDGRAYLFQAELFRSGRFVLELGPLADFFPARQILPGASAYSKYPPGHSGLLALGVACGDPLLWTRVLGLVLPALAFDLGRRAGIARPLLGAWLFSLSPMLLGTQGLWLSHATSLPLSVVALWAAAAGLDAAGAGRRAWGFVGLSSVAVSCVALARPGTGVVLAGCLVGALASRGARPLLRLLPIAVLCALPSAGLFFWHASQSTGSALVPPYVQYAREVSPNDSWGLVNLPTAWTNTGFNLARLTAWGFGFGGGLLLPLLGVLRGGAGYRWLLLGPALGLLGFHALLRFHGVPWAGPLYLVEGWVGLALLGAHGLASIPRRGVGALALGLGALGSAWALGAQFSEARNEQALRSAPRRAGLAWLAAHPNPAEGPTLVLVPLGDETARRRYHLAPPLVLAGRAGSGEASSELLLARDPGDAEVVEALRTALGAGRVLRFERASGDCTRIER